MIMVVGSEDMASQMKSLTIIPTSLILRKGHQNRYFDTNYSDTPE